MLAALMDAGAVQRPAERRLCSFRRRVRSFFRRQRRCLLGRRTVPGRRFVSDLDREFDGGAFFPANVYLDKGRDADDVEPVLLQISMRDGNRLDRLIHCSGADCLYVRMLVLSDNTGDGACHRGGP